MDTITRECIICHNEGDCIEGICSECAELTEEERAKVAEQYEQDNSQFGVGA